MDTREWIDASTISGNASQELKQSLADLISAEAKLNKARSTPGGITSGIARTGRRISIVPKAEEPERPEGHVVAEITVKKDMLNGRGTIHGACSALLIDNRVPDTISILPEPSFFVERAPAQHSIPCSRRDVRLVTPHVLILEYANDTLFPC